MEVETRMYYDNYSVLNSYMIPEYTLKEKHVYICYCLVR